MTGQSHHTADEATPVEDIKTPTVKSFHRFIRSILILSLSVLCVIGGLLIYQLHTRLDKAVPILPTMGRTVSGHVRTGLPARPIVPVLQKAEQLPNVQTSVTADVSDTATTIAQQKDTPFQPEEAVTKEVPAPTPSTNTVIDIDGQPAVEQPSETKTDDTVSEAEAAETPAPIANAPYFTLHDALQLRDHLQAGSSCRTDFQKLLKTQTRYHAWHALIEQLTPVCAMDESPLDDMRSLFRKEHKRAVIAYYRMHNPWWLAYLKAVPATMVEIRRIQPTGNTPLDLLSQAQNALIRSDLKQAIKAVYALPEPMRAAFAEFRTQAELYLKAQDEAEQLVLSFERKGK